MVAVEPSTSLHTYTPISEHEIERYADLDPGWGFGGLGYVTYKRTYARPIYREDAHGELVRDLDGEPIIERTEEWHETVRRVVNGAQEIGAKLTDAEMRRLYDDIFFLRASVSGRALWQMGTSNVQRIGGDALVNCLSGDTMVTTRYGAKRIDDLAAGGSAIVMTDNGKWVVAEVRSFGMSSTTEVHLRRGNQVKTVRATADHKWIKRGRDGRVEVTTAELSAGDKLVSVSGQSTKTMDMSLDGVRHGLVFGDGSVYPQGSRAFVASGDRVELEHLFLEYKSTDTDAGTVYRGLPRSYKSAPDLNESRGYLYGWLAGYFAADGHARNGKAAHLDSTRRDHVQLAKDVATIIGIKTGPIYKQERVSNLTGKPSTIYSVGLEITDPEFFLLAKHRGSFDGSRRPWGDWTVESVGEYGDPEEVFCAVVPDTHTFVLEDNLLTHNCWMVDVGDPSDFPWALERLMLGGGVGFSVDKPTRLGVVQKAHVVHRDANDSDFIVPDSREGWAELMLKVMMAYLNPDKDAKRNFTYATHLIREKGKRIHGFGGTASGPDILIEGIEQMCGVLDAAADRYLTSVDILDLNTIIGSIVVAGNVRRSAMIALGELWDRDYIEAKRWDLGDIPNNRAMSNNTVYVTSEQMQNMPDHIWDGYIGNGEPYGFFNLEASQEFGRMGELRPDYTIVGCNPCGEIPLAHRGSCNLAELNLPRISSQEELVDVASRLYKVQKAVAAMPYLDRVSEEVIHRDMRIGMSVTGVAQSTDKLEWLSPTYEALRELDREWSHQHGYNESVRLTTIQPSGTKSFMFGSTPGAHPAYSQFFIKAMRMAADDVLVRYCEQRGYEVEPLRKFDGSIDDRTVIVNFPCEFPQDTILAKDMDAIAQLDLVRHLQKTWADNSISITVYYRLEELEGIKSYLAQHWHEMKSVSFLLHSDHGFDQAPMQEITEEEFLNLNERVEGVGERIWDNTYTSYLDDSCATGSCPIR